MRVIKTKPIKPNLIMVANTDFKIVGADSGRNQTGFHNLPNGDCKGFYTSRFKGGCFLMPDLSAAEVKMVAGTAGEETMIQAFKDGLDIHNFNASKIFNIPIEEVNKNQRKIAKGVTFGILYGSTVKALALNYFKGDVAKAQELLDNFFNQFPKLKKYVDEKHNQSDQYGYINNYTNRILYIEDIMLKSGKPDVGSRHRRAQNVGIQGGSEDVAGWIDWNIAMYFLENKMLSKTVMFIHDSFELDIFPTELFETIKFCDKLLNHDTAEKWAIPMSSDVVVGPSIGQEIEISTKTLQEILTSKDEEDIELKQKMIEQGIINQVINIDSNTTKWNYVKLGCPKSGPGTIEDVYEMIEGTKENPNGWRTAYKEIIEVNKEENKNNDIQDYISWKLLMQGSHAPLKSNFGENVTKGTREYLILNELRDDYWNGYEPGIVNIYDG